MMLNESCTALILAGGAGRRLGTLTQHTPKPFLTVAGRPFIAWMIDFLVARGITRVLVSLGYQAQAAKLILDQLAREHPSVTFQSVVEPSPLGTGGAIQYALNQATKRFWPLSENILVMNGDSIIITAFPPLMDLYRRRVADMVMVGRAVDNTSRYGALVIDAQCQLRAFHEKQAGQGLINGGMYLCQRACLESLSVGASFSFEALGIPTLIAQGAAIYVHTVSDPFIDIGTSASFSAATDFVQRYMEKEAV